MSWRTHAIGLLGTLALLGLSTFAEAAIISYSTGEFVPSEWATPGGHAWRPSMTPVGRRTNAW
jgi:hypothetical protein